MSMTDQIADMLTRVRNALMVGRKDVEVPYSRTKEGIALVLVEEGFLLGCDKLEMGVQSALRLRLKYAPDGGAVIHEMSRYSKPGRRVYRGAGELPRVREGMGVAIVSTPQGVLSDRTCRARRVGGEVLCTVW